MARSTYMTFLMMKSGDTWGKVCDIKSYPDLGGAPEMLEITTLSDAMQRYINGIQSLEALEFEANYDLNDYNTIRALIGEEHEYAVWFGGTKAGKTVTPTGDAGKFEFTGEISAFVNGGGVNEVGNMTVTIAPTSEITLGT